MAQKTEKEETEFKAVPETITPCINNSASSAAIIQQPKVRSPRSMSPRSATSTPVVKLAGLMKEKRDLVVDEAEASFPVKRAVNRCSGCRKKVGLTGFRCRCGELFCAEHRYSDRHDCGFDYKSAGREAIARENPVVKAAKIVKI